MTRQKATTIGFTAILMWALLALMTIGSAPVPPFLLNALCFGIGGTIGLIWIGLGAGFSVLGRISWKVYAFGTIGLFGYHALWTPISIDQPVGVAMMYLLSWSSGIGIGLIFKAATPWAPDFFTVATTAFTRANFVFSGKMFVANMTPMSVLKVFMWNPLFHCIDQTRGFMFLNYEPRYTSALYPVVTTFVLIVIGLMAERYTEKHISASWNAKR